MHRNKIVVFDRSGDAVFSGSTRSLGNSVKDACEAIGNAGPITPQASVPATSPTDIVAPAPTQSSPQPQQPLAASLEISSTPKAADIEIDGNFAGDTPSNIGVTPGDHTVALKKAGYDTWQRKIRTSSGKVTLTVDLQPSPASAPQETSNPGPDTGAPQPRPTEDGHGPGTPGKFSQLSRLLPRGWIVESHEGPQPGPSETPGPQPIFYASPGGKAQPGTIAAPSVRITTQPWTAEPPSLDSAARDAEEKAKEGSTLLGQPEQTSSPGGRVFIRTSYQDAHEDPPRWESRVETLANGQLITLEIYATSAAELLDLEAKTVDEFMRAAQ